MLKALIFDVDGTLADTESAHRLAFNAAFREVGLDWHWHESLYARLLDVTGGKERLQYYWRMVDPDVADGRRVNGDHRGAARHQDAPLRRAGRRGQLPLRPGILRLIREAQAARLPIAIATTTTPANVDALLRTPLGSDWRAQFAAVCDGATAGAQEAGAGRLPGHARRAGAAGRRLHRHRGFRKRPARGLRGRA